jgi:hypothetical protein
MNKYNVATANLFKSEENILWLKKQLMIKFGLHKPGGNKIVKRSVYNFINENIERLVGDFDIKQLMNYSSPINHPGIEPDIYSQTKCINNLFLQDRYDFISQNILDNQSGSHGDFYDRKIYGTVGISDVYPASGRTQYFGYGSAEGSNSYGIINTDNNNQLTPMGLIKPSLDPVASWDRTSRPIQMRDDSKGKDGAEVSTNAGAHYSTPLQNSSFNYSFEYNDDNDGVNDGNDDLYNIDTQTGNKSLASSHHIQALVGNDYYKALNSQQLWRGPNGNDSTFDPDDFNNGGAEYEQVLFNIGQGNVRSGDLSKRDTPKYYERSLSSRPYQYDVDESLSGFEYENMSESGKPLSRDYDMNSLHCRINRRGKACVDDKRPQQNHHRAFGPSDPYKNETSYMSKLKF